MKEKIRQFLCGLTGHGSASAQVTKESGISGYHRYCPDCKKTLVLSFSDRLEAKDLEFLMRKL